MNSQPKLGSPANLFWIAIASLGVLAWCFAPQTWDWYQARRMARMQPCLGLELRPLIDSTPDETAGSKETLFGYEFEVPWRNVDAKGVRHQGMLIASNGHSLIFWDPADRQQFLGDASQSMQHPNIKDAFASALGNDATRSNYDLLEHMLNITPEQISPILSKREANGRLTLLRIKSAIYCNNGHPAFYSFHRGDLNCLQIGEPGLSRDVEVICFDGADRELNFHFSARQDSSEVLSRGEINRVIQTLHAVENPSVGRPVGAAHNSN